MTDHIISKLNELEIWLTGSGFLTEASFIKKLATNMGSPILQKYNVKYEPWNDEILTDPKDINAAHEQIALDYNDMISSFVYFKFVNKLFEVDIFQEHNSQNSYIRQAFEKGMRDSYLAIMNELNAVADSSNSNAKKNHDEYSKNIEEIINKKFDNSLYAKLRAVARDYEIAREPKRGDELNRVQERALVDNYKESIKNHDVSLLAPKPSFENTLFTDGTVAKFRRLIEQFTNEKQDIILDISNYMHNEYKAANYPWYGLFDPKERSKEVPEELVEEIPPSYKEQPLDLLEPVEKI